MRIVITDVTRFSDQDIVCIAGICPETGSCIRPLPYLSRDRCREYGILPGAILDGQFSPRNSVPPHVEDCSYTNLTPSGPCSTTMFHDILDGSRAKSVSEGFSVPMVSHQKCVPVDTPPPVSIITTRARILSLQIIRNEYNKLRVHFSDDSGEEFRYLSLTDLALYEHLTQNGDSRRALIELNNLIHAQREVFLRIGLSREYKSPDGRRGYWIQVNGIYTFPEYLTETRCLSAE